MVAMLEQVDPRVFSDATCDPGTVVLIVRGRGRGCALAVAKCKYYGATGVPVAVDGILRPDGSVDSTSKR